MRTFPSSSGNPWSLPSLIDVPQAANEVVHDQVIAGFKVGCPVLVEGLAMALTVAAGAPSSGAWPMVILAVVFQRSGNTGMKDGHDRRGSRSCQMDPGKMWWLR